MGVSALLGRMAARRGHVILVEVSGYWQLRAEVERALLSRGWCVAVSSADADVLAVCGVPGPETTHAIVKVWDQLPGPRVRVDIAGADGIESALDRAAAEIIDQRRHGDDLREPPNGDNNADISHGHHAAMSHGDHAHMDHSDPHAGMDHSGHAAMNHGGDGARMDHGDHDAGMDHHHAAMSHGADGGHGDTNHGAHEHMGHGEMDMAPAGIALAAGGPDRDGLEMDELHVRLGPVLNHWPAGMVLRCTLQGDVITATQVSVIDGERVEGHNEGMDSCLTHVAARQCDRIIDVLALAGWARAAAIARQARDLLLDEPDVDRAQPMLARLDRTVRRSWLLRWSLRNLCPLDGKRLEALRLPDFLAGDAYDRLLTQSGHVRGLVSNNLSPAQIAIDSNRIIDALPELVTGLDMATARIVIAGLSIDTATTHGTGPCG